ncbi:MAG TPA: hypothetical protein HA360_00905 [Nanoarchaeota archaeon]|nr:hypothetical protein [Candidatus Woesearchaeota archaeon]HIH15643.1 hypothetical protein [Nanoarchaeota archaeon]HIH58458.1 hypothetical protein [Nanoarchaeota archaeon]HII13611.1 hypothetical protein [Nanoarchaeota archaeon]HIJ04526.1 hypothetical protein [Nanoarchaeota archaeon]
MRFTKVFRLACLSYLGAIAAGNFIPDGCAAKKVVVATKPAVPVEEIAPTGDLGEDTERLNALHPEYKLAGNDLVALTRMLYFEDAGDRLLHGDAEQKKGYAAVAEVIKNRLFFDICSADAAVQNPTCGREKVQRMYDGDKGLAAIIEQNIVRNNKKIYQFTSQSDFSEYFTVASLARGMNYLVPKKVEGKIVKDTKSKTVSVPVFDEKQIALAYSALLGVLEGNIDPLTDGALSYKNSGTSSQVWDDTEIMKVSILDCSVLRRKVDKKARKAIQEGKAECRIEQSYVHDFTQKIGSHSFYTLEEGERREVVFDNSRGNAFVDGVYEKGLSSRRYNP